MKLSMTKKYIYIYIHIQSNSNNLWILFDCVKLHYFCGNSWIDKHTYLLQGEVDIVWLQNVQNTKHLQYLPQKLFSLHILEHHLCWLRSEWLCTKPKTKKKITINSYWLVWRSHSKAQMKTWDNSLILATLRLNILKNILDQLSKPGIKKSSYKNT